ncbi:MAG: pilus assembly protein TadG-related protein, partial [Hyphomicrobiales bacterium]|nr:pilus assembly protein TadG-related protein [Hyphomicrobiales bacterium]
MLLKQFRKNLQQTAAPLHRLAKDTQGNTAVIFGLSVIPLVMIASMAIDFGNSVRIHNELQVAADAGVLAAATAMATGEDDTSKTEVANETFFANLNGNTLSGFSANPQTVVDFPGKEVTMTVSVRNQRMFSTLLADHIDIAVNAKAVIDPGTPICMMALNPNTSDALAIDGTADLVADGCSIHVNSSDGEALRQVGSGGATAESFCVHGDYVGSNFTPMPQRDCRVENDPLKDLFASAWSSVNPSVCDFQSADVFSGGGGGGGETVLLEPGVYCGELEIRAGDTAILQSGSDGVYVFVNGDIDIRSGGTLRNFVQAGDGVTPNPGETFPSETVIILAGAGNNAGVLEVNGGGNLIVRAPSSGPFSGIAIAQPYGAAADKPHLITGGGDVDVDGIIYIPDADL